ncbi:DUF1697 domain-containing protein [Candidatus Saccharibacteria bacterium]|nr:DUF1697 domain-containing protein [Candidatus Saccharibacteria bacterium]
MTRQYLALLRGINVGGKNKLAMPELKTCFEELGYGEVHTYLATGNVLFTADKDPSVLAAEIEQVLPASFALDTELVKVLVLSREQLQAVVDGAPAGFGTELEKYYSDAIFLMGIPAADAFAVFKPREGVDAVWPGDGVIYSRRLAVERTKSRLSAIIASPLYKSMTIRSWGTVTRLLKLLDS